MKRITTILLLLTLLVGCIGGGGLNTNAVTVDVLVNSGASDWASAVLNDFNKANEKTADGTPIRANLIVDEAGNAAVGIADGTLAPALWIPDDVVWANVAADRGNGSYQTDCESVATSPLVIGMWRDVADALGYPGRELGWLDVGSLAADQSAWAYYSGGQFGDSLRLGHTHPGISGSGTSTLLALVQAAESKETAVTPEEIAKPIVQASVGAFESAVATFANATSLLGSEMGERGASYLGAGVMYENIVLSNGNGDIVPVYPFEGTFVATHPACINVDMGAIEVEGAGLIRAFMLGEWAQGKAAEYGLRPVADGVDLTNTPLNTNNGVRLDQPQTIFQAPSVDSVYAVQELWQSSRKPVHLAMLIDTSGSMEDDRKIDGAKTGAVQFVEQMGDNDLLTLIFFETEPFVSGEAALVSEKREDAIRVIQDVRAVGGTAMYDAIGMAAGIIDQYNSEAYANAIIVLSDGDDRNSVNYRLDDRLFDLASANGTTVSTIAYGQGANNSVLERLAVEGNGQFYVGGTADIAQIYEENSVSFGGRAGIGR